MTTPTQLPLPLPAPLSPSNRETLARLARRDWHQQAACAGYRCDDWFPHPADRRTAARALAVCRRCPVITECLASGLVGNEHGIWGGTTEDDRDLILADLAAGLPIPVARAGRMGEAA